MRLPINSEDLESYIHKGMKNGYLDSARLLRIRNAFLCKIREEIINVNVAKALMEWDKDYLYKIQFEYPILDFVPNAFPPTKMNIKDIFNMETDYRKNSHANTDKRCKKIDLAITQEVGIELAGQYEQSLVGIELKGINIKTKAILKDISRICEAMGTDDPIGKNNIQFGFCGFIKLLQSKTITYEKQFEEFVSKNEKDWSNHCRELESKYPLLGFTISVNEIQKTIFEELKITNPDDYDFSEIAEMTGGVIGIVITVKKK